MSPTYTNTVVPASFPALRAEQFVNCWCHGMSAFLKLANAKSHPCLQVSDTQMCNVCVCEDWKLKSNFFLALNFYFSLRFIAVLIHVNAHSRWHLQLHINGHYGPSRLVQTGQTADTLSHRCHMILMIQLFFLVSVHITLSQQMSDFATMFLTIFL